MYLEVPISLQIHLKKELKKHNLEDIVPRGCHRESNNQIAAMQYENAGFKGEMLEKDQNIAASQKIVTKAALQKKIKTMA